MGLQVLQAYSSLTRIRIMSITTTGNMPSLLKEGLYLPKEKKKTPVKAGSVKKTNTKNKGN